LGSIWANSKKIENEFNGYDGLKRRYRLPFSPSPSSKFIAIKPSPFMTPKKGNDRQKGFLLDFKYFGKGSLPSAPLPKWWRGFF